MENSTKAMRKPREEFWIGQFYDNQQRCYNFQKTVQDAPTCYSLTPNTTRNKMSIAAKNHSSKPGVREAMSQAQKKWSIEHPEEVAEATRKRSESVKKRHDDPERQAQASQNYSKAHKKRLEDPVCREAQSKQLAEGLAGRWAKPQAHIKARELWDDPVYRAKQIEARKLAWIKRKAKIVT